jgi:hypothetical protein
MHSWRVAGRESGERTPVEGSALFRGYRLEEGLTRQLVRELVDRWLSFASLEDRYELHLPRQGQSVLNDGQRLIYDGREEIDGEYLAEHARRLEHSGGRVRQLAHVTPDERREPRGDGRREC